jgi:uncharacterized RDD family membrane protein YckC
MREPAELSPCPICHRSVKTRQMQKLYDIPICRKCRNGFANRRQFAYILDLFCFWILWLLLGMAIEFAFPGVLDVLDGSYFALIIAQMLFLWVFLPLVFFLKDGFNGHSPGKWLCGVRVVDKDTFEPTGFARSLKRNLVLLIPFAWLIVALQLLRGPRSGDKWARTRVVLKKHAHRPPFDIRGILCTHCGYNLTGNVSGRCPECGHDIPVALGRVPTAVPVMQG